MVPVLVLKWDDGKIMNQNLALRKDVFKMIYLRRSSSIVYSLQNAT